MSDRNDVPAGLVVDRLAMQIAEQAKRIALLEARLQQEQEHSRQEEEDADAEG